MLVFSFFIFDFPRKLCYNKLSNKGVMGDVDVMDNKWNFSYNCYYINYKI